MQYQSKKGFTLLEITMALTIFSIGIMGIIALFPHGLKTIQSSLTTLEEVITFECSINKTVNDFIDNYDHVDEALTRPETYSITNTGGIFVDENYKGEVPLFQMSNIELNALDPGLSTDLVDDSFKEVELNINNNKKFYFRIAKRT